MDTIQVMSFAKINLSIDVGEAEGGYHSVDMIMQQLSFHDDVQVRFVPGKAEGDAKFSISLRTNRYYLPTDARNLAYRAAEVMIEHYGERVEGGCIEIDIKKRIPVAAGMAGGSGNGAAVIHGLNALWKLRLSLGEICKLCEELGSDVPFSAVGQARANPSLPRYLRKDSMATSCVRATGRGTEMEPLTGIRKCIVIAKPSINVSTAEVYRGIDSCQVTQRPDNDRLQGHLPKHEAMYEDFINVLEAYTLKAYPQVATLKARMEQSDARCVLMSGSGPTVFAVFDRMDGAKKLSDALRKEGYEAYWTRTTR